VSLAGFELRQLRQICDRIEAWLVVAADQEQSPAIDAAVDRNAHRAQHALALR